MKTIFNMIKVFIVLAAGAICMSFGRWVADALPLYISIPLILIAIFYIAEQMDSDK